MKNQRLIRHMFDAVIILFLEFIFIIFDIFLLVLLINPHGLMAVNFILLSLLVSIIMISLYYSIAKILKAIKWIKIYK